MWIHNTPNIVLYTKYVEDLKYNVISLLSFEWIYKLQTYSATSVHGIAIHGLYFQHKTHIQKMGERQEHSKSTDRLGQDSSLPPYCSDSRFGVLAW